MKEKTLKGIIYLSGILCFFAFLAARHETMFNLVLHEKIIPEYWENTKYGELYYFNFIRNFREKDLPEYITKYRHTDRHPNLDEADILVFGDSFMDFSRMVTFPERLGDTLGKKVYYERFFNTHQPLAILEQKNYENNKPKILIYESAERYIPVRFSQVHNGNTVYGEDPSSIKQTLTGIRDWLFVPDIEVKYTTLLSRSIFTTFTYSTINTLKFDAFKYIPSTTPVYKLGEEDPWLFYYETVNEDSTSYYYQFTDDEINTYCDHIADLSRKLQSRYNFQMIFMPIPSKYTIYHKLINDDPYNNFLPRLYAGLSERGVPYIDLYQTYMNSEEILYYGTDTHWNKKGLNIALDEMVDLIENIQPNYIAHDSIKPKN